MSYTRSQKKALRSDCLCLIFCVFAICMVFHTASVVSETESICQALDEERSPLIPETSEHVQPLPSLSVSRPPAETIASVPDGTADMIENKGDTMDNYLNTPEDYRNSRPLYFSLLLLLDALVVAVAFL